MTVVKHVLKPTMLFAVGSIAGTAHATVEQVDYSASYGAGTPIEIGSFGAQYNFIVQDYDNTASFPGGTAGTKAKINTLNGNTIYARQNAAYYPDASASSLPSAKTADTGSAKGTGNGYYGLRFTGNGAQYSGYALVDSGTPPVGSPFPVDGNGEAAGLHVSEIGYQVEAAPEPDAWALMIVGFGGVGMALRHRRRAQRAARATA